MGRFDDEDTGRHVRLGDIKELRSELQKSGEASDRALKDHRDEDRTAFTSLKGEVEDVKQIVDQLALDAVQQNGKLDTLIARTDGRLNVLDERTVSLQARTKSRDRLDEKARDAEVKTRDTQQLEVTAKRTWLRNLFITLVAGLFTLGGAIVGYLAHGGGK